MISQIVDFAELSSFLKVPQNTLRKKWRDLPHFSVGTGRNLKSARFDVNHVLIALQLNSPGYRNYQYLISGQDSRKSEPNKKNASIIQLKHRTKKRIKGTSKVGDLNCQNDPNNLLKGIK